MHQRIRNHLSKGTFGKPHDIESGTGTYALILHADQEDTIRVGRLGQLRLKPGFYLYVGSAFGPGGLRARIEHHRKLSHRPHWHIDYVRPFLRVCDVWFSYDPLRREHTWAATISKLPGVSAPLHGFGCSDCRCDAHLFYAPRAPELRVFTKLLLCEIGTHARVDHCS